jgi:hypothetical protein
VRVDPAAAEVREVVVRDEDAFRRAHLRHAETATKAHAPSKINIAAALTSTETY